MEDHSLLALAAITIINNVCLIIYLHYKHDKDLHITLKIEDCSVLKSKNIMYKHLNSFKSG